MGERVETRYFSGARSYKEKSVVAAGFFDRVLRNDQNYNQKWEYVRENPVRAGLALRADDWPY